MGKRNILIVIMTVNYSLTTEPHSFPPIMAVNYSLTTELHCYLVAYARVGPLNFRMMGLNNLILECLYINVLMFYL